MRERKGEKEKRRPHTAVDIDHHHTTILSYHPSQHTTLHPPCTNTHVSLYQLVSDTPSPTHYTHTSSYPGFTYHHPPLPPPSPSDTASAAPLHQTNDFVSCRQTSDFSP